MALYLAGFRGVPEELREAARMDGASEWRVYRHVVFPHLRPVTFSALIILGHISIKVFDLIVAIGGKQLITQTPAVYMWILIYDARDYAKGAAIATVLLVVVSLLVIPYMISTIRSERSHEHRVRRPRGAVQAQAPARIGAQILKYGARVCGRRVLLPVYVLLVASFKSGTEADPSRAWALPEVWSVDAWREAWNGEQYGLLPFLKNSLKLVIPATLISTVLGSLNRFVLSRWRFPGSEIVFLFLLFGMFIPYQAVMIPLAQIFIDAGFPEGLPSWSSRTSCTASRSRR